jgi:hypothetical protein
MEVAWMRCGVKDMAEQDRIYVDGSLPATLNDGAGTMVDFATLEEAVLAWRSLKAEQKIRATIKLIGGRVFKATDVDRIRYGMRQ